jgi:hypothetical protein
VPLVDPKGSLSVPALREDNRLVVLAPLRTADLAGEWARTPLAGWKRLSIIQQIRESMLTTTAVAEKTLQGGFYFSFSSLSTLLFLRRHPLAANANTRLLQN